jgi:hypothetical protein
MNNSVYDQLLRTQSVSDHVLISSYEHVSLQHRGAISWQYQCRLYTKALFQRCFVVTSDAELTLGDFRKHHFNILRCLTLVDKAWQHVTYKTMNIVARKCCSQSI